MYVQIIYKDRHFTWCTCARCHNTQFMYVPRYLSTSESVIIVMLHKYVYIIPKGVLPLKSDQL